MGNIPVLQKVRGEGGSGSTKVRFAIQGTTSDPKFVPNVGAMATSAVTGIVKSQAGGALQKAQVPAGVGGLLGKKKPK